MERTGKRKSASEAGQVWSCSECGIQATPVRRQGPGGPRTLCNACGLRRAKRRRRSTRNAANNETGASNEQVSLVMPDFLFSEGGTEKHSFSHSQSSPCGIHPTPPQKSSTVAELMALCAAMSSAPDGSHSSAESIDGAGFLDLGMMAPSSPPAIREISDMQARLLEYERRVQWLEAENEHLHVLLSDYVKEKPTDRVANQTNILSKHSTGDHVGTQPSSISKLPAGDFETVAF